MGETPEGKTLRFLIGEIEFPDMPEKGIRGINYCSIQMMPNVPVHKLLSGTPPDGRVVIAAVRRQTMVGPPGQLPSEENVRYWTGSKWARSIEEARVYTDPNVARNEASQ